jgi:hypothetical protein
MFESRGWIDIPGVGRTKIIYYDDFYGNDLSPTIEYGQKYCDVIYAKRIIQKMGYRVGIGMAFHVYKS